MVMVMWFVCLMLLAVSYSCEFTEVNWVAVDQYAHFKNNLFTSVIFLPVDNEQEYLNVLSSIMLHNGSYHALGLSLKHIDIFLGDTKAISIFSPNDLSSYANMFAHKTWDFIHHEFTLHI